MKIAIQQEYKCCRQKELLSNRDCKQFSAQLSFATAAIKFVQIGVTSRIFGRGLQKIPSGLVEGIQGHAVRLQQVLYA